VRDRLTLVTLTAEEYYTTVERAADRQFTSGRIYDALPLRCAGTSSTFAQSVLP